ncbi:hypothetical protein OPT61_g6588 [Boeremia exigua]|uniref:Uncharacterized protein n=1 Tax=Boeremia exigua TaxID=749465 RepID=A0ACC2I5H0_9PLEO|nr:hypothetical protein OPT61_g6588 [Boeremia exigua]
MCPLIDDLSRADALPEHPPDGAMSYSEFVRSGSNDPEMRPLESMINHMIANEMRVQESREAVYQEICAGRKDVWVSCNEILSNERNASCQRVGFLLGHATAFRMDSDILTRAHTFFTTYSSPTQVNSAAAAASGTNEADGDAASIMTNGDEPPNNGAEANGVVFANGGRDEDAVVITNHHDTENEDAQNGHPHLHMVVGAP